MNEPTAGSGNEPVAEKKETWLTGCLMPLGSLVLVVLICSGMVSWMENQAWFEMEQSPPVYGGDSLTEPMQLCEGLALPVGTKPIWSWSNNQWLDSDHHSKFEVPLEAKQAFLRSPIFRSESIPPERGPASAEERLLALYMDAIGDPLLTDQVEAGCDYGGLITAVRCGMENGRFVVYVDWQET